MKVASRGSVVTGQRRPGIQSRIVTSSITEGPAVEPAPNQQFRAGPDGGVTVARCGRRGGDFCPLIGAEVVLGAIAQDGAGVGSRPHQQLTARPSGSQQIACTWSIVNLHGYP